MPNSAGAATATLTDKRRAPTFRVSTLRHRATDDSPSLKRESFLLSARFSGRKHPSRVYLASEMSPIFTGRLVSATEALCIS